MAARGLPGELAEFVVPLGTDTDTDKDSYRKHPSGSHGERADRIERDLKFDSDWKTSRTTFCVDCLDGWVMG